jgi:hypothetical protein
MTIFEEEYDAKVKLNDALFRADDAYARYQKAASAQLADWIPIAFRNFAEDNPVILKCDQISELKRDVLAFAADTKGHVQIASEDEAPHKKKGADLKEIADQLRGDATVPPPGAEGLRTRIYNACRTLARETVGKAFGTNFDKLEFKSFTSFWDKALGNAAFAYSNALDTLISARSVHQVAQNKVDRENTALAWDKVEPKN